MSSLGKSAFGAAFAGALLLAASAHPAAAQVGIGAGIHNVAYAYRGAACYRGAHVAGCRTYGGAGYGRSGYGYRGYGYRGGAYYGARGGAYYRGGAYVRRGYRRPY